MPKIFRLNLTDNHLTALKTVSRLCNATPQAVAYAHGSKNRDYWRCYLNDLVRLGYLTTKLIYATSVHGRSGRKIGTLFALTERGAEALAEATGWPNGSIYYPKGGISATSPFHFPHRAAFLELLAAFLRLEATSERETLPNGDEQPSIEVLEMVPYFRQEGSRRLGEGKPLIAVELPEKDQLGKPIFLIPDAVLKLKIREKVRLMVLELHRETDPKKVIAQIRQHTEAMELGLFSERYNHPTTNFLLSVHEHPEKLKQVIQRLRGGEIENFERYSNGILFATLESILTGSISASFYHLNGEKNRLF